MKIIDARSGQEIIYADDVIEYPDGEWYRVLRVDETPFNARALVEGNHVGRCWVPLAVRFTHPSFFLQKVGFVPT